MSLTSAPSRLTYVRGAAVAIIGPVLSAAIYQPWQSSHFDIRDFSEFLPLLTHNPTTATRVHALWSYSASQGRLNPLSYLFIVLRWDLFGGNVALWQWARFLEMWIVIAMAFLLLRRLGASTRGAAAGAALYLASYPAQDGWLRLTAGEPVGTILLLAAAHLAVGYSVERHWRAAGAGIATFLCAAMLVKEMFVAAVPFLLLLASGGRAGLAYWTSSPRLRWLTGLTLTTVGLVLVPVAEAALRAGGDRYASLYGTAGLGLGRILAELQILLLPISPTASKRTGPTILTSVVFLWILTRGWAVGLAVRSVRAHRLRLLMVAASLPICAALAYLPWPVFSNFYAFPYFFASAIVLAMALTFLEDRAPRQAFAASLATVAIVMESSMLASREAQRSYALHRLDANLAYLIARAPELDTVIVATRSLPFQNWQGTAATLVRYAAAIDSTSEPPRSADIECEKAVQLANTGRGPTLLISYSDDCGTLRRPLKSVVQRFRYPTWPFLVLRTDSVRADLIAGRQLRN